MRIHSGLKFKPIKIDSNFNIHHYNFIILTSPFGAKVFFEQNYRNYNFKKIQFAAIGQATAKILKQNGIEKIFIPSIENAINLAYELPNCKRVIHFCNLNAEKTLNVELAKRGINYKKVATYETKPIKYNKKAIKDLKKCKILVLASKTSAISVKNALEKYKIKQEFKIVSMGLQTTIAAKKLGLQEIYTAKSPNIKSIEEKIIELLN